MWPSSSQLPSSRCSAQEVSSVRVNGLDTPQAGKNPDYAATVAVPEHYQLDTTFGTNGIQWYNCEQMELTPEDTFVVGETYCIAIRLITAGEGFQFTDDLEFYINDKVVTPYGYWDNVVVDGNTVTAYYTFRKAASAPILGANVSGSMTSARILSAAIMKPLAVSPTAKVSFKMSGMIPSYTCQNSMMDINASPTMMVRL